MAPLSADALVIGAGPAGCAAARGLALGGARVLLVDRHEFPRDKVCGDALIPDALAALTELGVLGDVLDVARRVSRVRVAAPDHTSVDLEGGCACLPRRALDDLLRRAAVRAGATFRAGLRAVAAIEDAGTVVGARCSAVASGEPVEIRAPVTILTTGAAADVLTRFGMCTRVGPSATAARIYVKVDAAYSAAWDHLCLAYSQSICPGYGWLFPGPHDVFNVGVGYFYDAAAPAEKNVRRMLATFLEEYPPARELMRHGTVLGPLKGAPLRTALVGSTLARPGLLVAGEAAGLTYSFSGEGIGKALQSGIIAARLALQHRDPRAIAEGYVAGITAAFSSRLRAYSRLQRWLAYPAFVNFLAHRGRSGRYVRTQLEGLLNETGDPEELLTWRGLFKALVS